MVIADTSCLIVLDRIGHLDLLQELFGKVVVTPTVRDEFGGKLPDWVQISEPRPSALLDELVQRLDAGEATSIALAFSNRGSMLIIDELKGRKATAVLEIRMVGTVGVLVMAKQKGLLSDVEQLVETLNSVGFRMSPDLIDILLKA